MSVTLRFIVEGEDGLGSPSLYRFTTENAELLQADGCLWDEGSSDTRETPIVSLGFKGITFLELRAFGARSDLHSKWGTIVPNPAWRLVQALATITSPKGVITIDGFSSYSNDRSEASRLSAALGCHQLSFASMQWGGGGGGGSGAVANAAAAIATGQAECVVVFRALAQGQDPTDVTG